MSGLPRVANLGRSLRLAAALVCLATACRPATPSAPTAPPGPSPVTVAADTPAPTHPALPTATTAPAATMPPTSTPPAARQLTSGGCCVQPTWSPDGSQVWFLDRPSSTAPSGLWAVDLDGGDPQFVTDRLGIYSPDRSLLAFPEGGQTVIERLATGERWVAPSAGRAVSFSPDGQQMAWSVATSTVNFDQRMVEIWVARVEGSEARVVAHMRGGGFSGWLPDGQHMLVSGRVEGEAEAEFVGVLSLADGAVRPIVSGRDLRGTNLSPGGAWLLYTVTFSGDPAQDGQYVVAVAGGEPLKLELYGAVRWRGEGKLLMIPLEWGSTEGLRVVEIDAATGEVRALTDPAQTPLPIGGGDWALSPDGRRIAFVSALDGNLWVLDLPE